jgi:hypothetical protein
LGQHKGDGGSPLLPDRYHLYVNDKLYSVHGSVRAADTNLSTVGKTFPTAKIELRTIPPGHDDYAIRYALYSRKKRG